MRRVWGRAWIAVLVTLPAAGVSAQPQRTAASASAKPQRAEAGGSTLASRHGLIAWEGPSGMFVNPTSTTLGKGQLAVQYCVLVFRQDGVSLAGHQGMLAYGLADWLEVGVSALLIDDFRSTTTRAGPLLRARVLDETANRPEVSVGGFLREGNELFARRTLFTAASKRLPLDEAGFFRAMPIHVGFRQFWEDERDRDGSVVFLGGKLELPRGVFLVAEISNRSDVFERTPHSFGLQVRRPDGFGFSLAGVQTGNQDRLGVFVGIGLSF